jgi:cytochrome c biogenesis protein CcmG, thiol:disulfide interchange protein DsbE
MLLAELVQTPKKLVERGEKRASGAKAQQIFNDLTARVNSYPSRSWRSLSFSEALRYPKSREPNSRSKPSFPAGCLATLVATGLLSALIGCYSGGKPTRIGSNAPDFTVQDSDHKVTLSQFRGQVVVLNFWGTFCPPCIEETPSLVQMQKRLKDKGVVVIAVSIDSDDAAYHKFLKDYKINLITVRDGAQKTSSLYGTFGWPETYVIDRNGVIRRKFIGAVDWSSPEITDYLSKL